MLLYWLTTKLNQFQTLKFQKLKIKTISDIVITAKDNDTKSEDKPETSWQRMNKTKSVWDIVPYEL